nr:unnamed protein product [Callosobruchus analis]
MPQTGQMSCTCCKKSGDDSKFVHCSVCKNNFYYSCVDLTQTDVKTLKNKANIHFTCKNCSTIGATLVDLRALVVSLQEEINALKSNRVDPAQTPAIDFEEIVQEVNDRQSRKNNLIIYGIVESTDQLGSNNTGGPRPIKITLRDSNDVRSCIKAAAKLKRHSTFSRINISFDRTPRQVLHYKKLKQEVADRSANGENGLKIKYVNGVPKVMAEN